MEMKVVKHDIDTNAKAIIQHLEGITINIASDRSVIIKADNISKVYHLAILRGKYLPSSRVDELKRDLLEIVKDHDESCSNGV